jgi:hypothetical protein
LFERDEALGWKPGVIAYQSRAIAAAICFSRSTYWSSATSNTTLWIVPQGAFQAQFTELRVPNFYNLRADPYERGTESFYYGDWHTHRTFLLVPAQTVIAKYLETFKEFPPRAKAASFTVSDAMEKITAASTLAR